MNSDIDILWFNQPRLPEGLREGALLWQALFNRPLLRPVKRLGFLFRSSQLLVLESMPQMMKDNKHKLRRLGIESEEIESLGSDLCAVLQHLCPSLQELM